MIIFIITWKHSLCASFFIQNIIIKNIQHVNLLSPSLRVALREKGRRALDTQRKHAGRLSVVGPRVRSRWWIIQGVLIRSADRQTDSGSLDRRDALRFFPGPSPSAALTGSSFLWAARLRSQGSAVSCDDVDSSVIVRLLDSSCAPCTAVVASSLLHSCTVPSFPIDVDPLGRQVETLRVRAPVKLNHDA